MLGYNTLKYSNDYIISIISFSYIWRNDTKSVIKEYKVIKNILYIAKIIVDQ